MASYRRWHIGGATLALAWLLTAAAAPAGETLPPPDPSAPPVHILLTIPDDSGLLAKQVALLNRELAASRGFLLRARSLDDADLVVEFTRYRSTMNDKGDIQHWWDGQVRLLAPPTPDVRLSEDVSRFSLLIIGRESWEIEPVVDLLERWLAKALGRQAQSVGGESI